MHEYGFLTGEVHQFLCHLVGLHLLDPLRPGFHRLSHGYPHVRVEDIGTLSAFLSVLRQSDAAAAFSRDLSAGLHQFFVGEVLFVGAESDVHSHLGSGHHPAVRPASGWDGTHW